MPNYNDLINTIQGAVNGFNKSLPSIQRGVLDEVLDQIRRFDVRDKKITNTVKNIRLLNSIKNRLQKVILTDDYKGSVREYLSVFTEVDKFNKAYFKEVEKTFKPPAVVREIKAQTIDDVIKSLTESGIGVNVSDKIYDLIKQNVTTGTSYARLAEQLREQILKTEKTPGILEKHVKQIATDSVNQYTAQYMNTVSGNLGYEWFRYQGKDILTTRPFCDAMTDRQFFHISEVPDLLKAKDLYYSDEAGGQTKVPIYTKTGLPHGLMEGTTVENFFVRRGGYNCGHQIFPVIERLVPKDVQDRVKATTAYRKFKGIEAEPPPAPKPAPKPKQPSAADKELNRAKSILEKTSDWDEIASGLGFKDKLAMYKQMDVHGGTSKEEFITKYSNMVKKDLTPATIKKLNGGASKEELPRVVNEAIRDWTSASYHIRDMSADNPIKKFFKKAAGTKTEHDTLFRGESFRIGNRTQEQFFENILNDFKVGKSVDFSQSFKMKTPTGAEETWDRSLLSFTHNIDKAFEFAQIESRLYKSILFTIKGKSLKGMDISKVSSYTTEKEVIVGNGNKYKVVSVKDDGEGNVDIELKEL